MDNRPWNRQDAHKITADASSIHPLTGFAATVIHPDGMILQIEKTHNSTYIPRVELAGYLFALQCLPKDGKPAILLHDQDDLPMMLGAGVSYQHNLEPEISELKTELQAREVVLVRASTQPEYRECHHRIRKFLKQHPDTQALTT